jgi:hypothetical protein
MRHDMARCGCGALVRLPSMKASAYRAQCEACVGKSRALLGAKPVEPARWITAEEARGPKYWVQPPMPSGWVEARLALGKPTAG